MRTSRRLCLYSGTWYEWRGVVYEGAVEHPVALIPFDSRARMKSVPVFCTASSRLRSVHPAARIELPVAPCETGPVGRPDIEHTLRRCTGRTACLSNRLLCDNRSQVASNDSMSPGPPAD